MWISASGMASPVGLSSEAACAAIRAGIDSIVELPYVDNDYEPIMGAALETLSECKEYKERLVYLLSVALDDCLSKTPQLDPSRTGIFLGLSDSSHPGSSSFFSAKLTELIYAKLGQAFHTVEIEIHTTGAVAGFQMLKSASILLRSRQVEHCLVCTVDSYINAQILLRLKKNMRLKTPTNADGVIPGEAAACILMSQKRPIYLGDVVTKVVGLGFGMEKASVLTEKPLLGLGLTEAAREAIKMAGFGFEKIDYRISDCSGESYGFREQSLMVSRLLRVRKDALPIWHPAEYIGSIGAASGICQVIIADRAIQRGYSPGSRIICCTSEEKGPRAIAIMEAK